MKAFRILFICGFFFFLASISCWGVKYYPSRPFPGAPLLVEVPERAKEVVFLGKTYRPFTFKGKHFVLAAISLGTKPGLYKAQIKGDSGGILEVRIYPKRYPSERLTVPPKMIHYPPEVLSRIKREVHLIKMTVSKVSSEIFLDGPFVWPASGRISSPFGFRRIYNGIPRSPHSGLDIALPEGTPVKAANRGKVALVGDFYLPGKTVILDHGLGIYTVYCHLKKILVQKGELVAKGETLALSGKSGRVTGPHLHFGVYIQGVKVDPKVLLEVF